MTNGITETSLSASSDKR